MAAYLMLISERFRPISAVDPAIGRAAGSGCSLERGVGKWDVLWLGACGEEE